MNQFELLQSRKFLPLFCVQFLGAFNDNVFRFALIIFITFTVADHTSIDASILVVASGGIFILPFFLFSSVAGQVADKYEKSFLIRRVKFTEMLVMAMGAVGFFLGDLYFLLFVLFLMGTQSTFFGPLKYGILPQHLTPDELTGGNGLIQLGTYAAILMGGVTGGMLASWQGLGPLPVVSCIVALAFCGWMCALAIPFAGPSDPSVTVNWNIAQATYRLLSYAAQSREIITLVLCISWFWFLGAAFLSMVPSYGKEFLKADEKAVTLLNVAFTIGIASGSLLCERISRRQIELGLFPFAAFGLTIFALDFYLIDKSTSDTTLHVGNMLLDATSRHAFLDLVAIGAFGGLFIVPLFAALQARVAPSRCARVIAALNVFNSLFMVASAIFTIALFSIGVTIPEVFGLVAGLNLCVLAAAVIALPEFQQRAGAMLRRITGTPALRDADE